MSTHNLCFDQKYEKYQNVLPENFPFLVVKFSIYLKRHVFVMLFTGEQIAPSEKGFKYYEGNFLSKNLSLPK